MAVYKSDGTKAHHMSDYIPPEELAKFLAKSGDTVAAAAIENQQKIGDSNIGHRLLSKMGWKARPADGLVDDRATDPTEHAPVLGSG